MVILSTPYFAAIVVAESVWVREVALQIFYDLGGLEHTVAAPVRLLVAAEVTLQVYEFIRFFAEGRRVFHVNSFKVQKLIFAGRKWLFPQLRSRSSVHAFVERWRLCLFICVLPVHIQLASWLFLGVKRVLIPKHVKPKVGTPSRQVPLHLQVLLPLQLNLPLQLL